MFRDMVFPICKEPARFFCLGTVMFRATLLNARHAVLFKTSFVALGVVTAKIHCVGVDFGGSAGGTGLYNGVAIVRCGRRELT